VGEVLGSLLYERWQGVSCGRGVRELVVEEVSGRELAVWEVSGN